MIIKFRLVQVGHGNVAVSTEWTHTGKETALSVLYTIWMKWRNGILCLCVRTFHQRSYYTDF